MECKESFSQNAPLWRLNSSLTKNRVESSVLTSSFLLAALLLTSSSSCDARSRHLVWINVFKILTVWISILSSAGICQQTFSFLLSLKLWLLFWKHRGFIFFRRFQSLTFTTLSCRSFGLIARLKTCLFIVVDLCVLVLHVCLILLLFHLHHILLPLPAEVSLMIPTASSSLLLSNQVNQTVI